MLYDFYLNDFMGFQSLHTFSGIWLPCGHHVPAIWPNGFGPPCASLPKVDDKQMVRRHVNQLITARFDWDDEEILGYYISFLKSLALRLNAETVKFFFNERLQQFPLYIEAVRFFIPLWDD